MKTPHPRNFAMGKSFEAVVISLKNESDRGTVVLAVAWLDEALTRILSAYLKPINSSKDNFLQPGRALGDFGTKIILAERLNLINAYVAGSLTTCRTLRNDFAHMASDLSFETPSVKDRVAHLFTLNEDIINAMSATLKEANLLHGYGEDTHINKMKEKFGTKDLFRFVCGFISSGLSGIEYGLKQSNPEYDKELLSKISNS